MEINYGIASLIKLKTSFKFHCLSHKCPFCICGSTLDLTLCFFFFLSLPSLLPFVNFSICLYMWPNFKCSYLSPQHFTSRNYSAETCAQVSKNIFTRLRNSRFWNSEMLEVNDLSFVVYIHFCTLWFFC
jgi:hypothetical protein